MLDSIRNAWAQVLSALLGIWLMAAPAVLGYAGTPADAHRILGPVAASFAIIAVWEHMRPLRWVEVPLGGLLVFSPLVLDVGLAAAANGVVVGVLLVALAFVRGGIEEDYGGGWKPVWTGNLAEPEPEPSRRDGAR